MNLADLKKPFLPERYQGATIPPLDDAVAARFWEKTIPEPNTGCFIWEGAHSDGGYGTFWTHGRARKSHRVAYAIANGGLGAGLDVMHSCDNPFCVNPSHLKAAPTAANIRDAFHKGRLHRRGDKNSRTKIPDEMVPVIHRLDAVGVTSAQMAHAFEVDPSTIRKYLTGKRQVA